MSSANSIPTSAFTDSAQMDGKDEKSANGKAHPSIPIYDSSTAAAATSKSLVSKATVQFSAQSLNYLISFNGTGPLAVTSSALPAYGIEGNISVGKSTLTAILKSGETLCGRTVRVEPEMVNLKLLDKYYDGLKQKPPNFRYVFTLQMDTISTRGHTLQMAPYRYGAKTDVLLIDRTVLGDLIFMIAHWLNGRITWDEVLIYGEKARLERFVEIVPAIITAFIYLHRTPTNCRVSVGQRTGTVDSHLKEDYLSELDDLYFAGTVWMADQAVKCATQNRAFPPIHVWDWQEFGDPKQQFETLYGKCGFYGASVRCIVWEPQPGKSAQENRKDAIALKILYDATLKTFDVPNKDIEPIPEGVFPNLRDPKYRFRHTQTWKNELAALLHRGKHVLLTRTVPRAERQQWCLYDLFGALPQSLKHD